MKITAKQIHVNPALISRAVETSEVMIRMRRALKKRRGISDAKAGELAGRLLEANVQRFGMKYLDAMMQHVEKVFELRERAAGSLEKVLTDVGYEPAAAAAELKSIFRDIETEMNAITDPERFLAKEEVRAEEFQIFSPEEAAAEALARQKLQEQEARNRSGTTKAPGRYSGGMEALTSSFKALGKSGRDATKKAARLVPRELWSAAVSDTQQGLERNIARLKQKALDHGMSPAEVEQLEAAARRMAKDHAAAHGMPGGMEAVRRAQAVDNLVAPLEAALDREPKLAENSKVRGLQGAARRKRLEQLRDLIPGNKYFERLAAENPGMLLELFEASGATTRTGLAKYIRRRMVTHFKGLAGEFTAAFRLGDEGLILLKGPDYDVTIPGTDLVGVTKEGRIWLIDNKAMTAEELTSVTSLTSNIATNIADDSAAFVKEIGRYKRSDIGDAVKRIESASQEIKALTKGMNKDQVGATEIQKKINVICKKYRIDRVVTNAGGNVTGLSDALRRAKILLEDLNALGSE